MDVPAWVREARGPLRDFLDTVWEGGPEGTRVTRNRWFRWRKRLAARGIDLAELMEAKQERVVFRGKSRGQDVRFEWLEMRVKWRGLADADGAPSSTGEPVGRRGDVEPAARSDGGPASPSCTVISLRSPTGAVVIASEASAR